VTPTAIGVDVGGTKVNALRVTADGKVLDRATLPTPEDADTPVDVLIDAARAVLDVDVSVIGVGAAGLLERSTGVMRFAPNIAWRDAPILARVHEAFGLPTVVDNDCTTATFGEWRLGAGRGHDDVLYVGVGTGIGGGIVMGGSLQRGARGFAGEIGHLVVEPDGPVCGCGNHGCWEVVASGNAIMRDGAAAVTRHEHSAIAILAGGEPDRVTGALVSQAARDGDATALGILAEVGHRLGQGIAGLVNVLDPSIVIVGGGVAEAGEQLLVPARASYLTHVEGRELRADVGIVEAELGPDGAAIGAAVLAMEEAAP
jgi:glucokinase